MDYDYDDSYLGNEDARRQRPERPLLRYATEAFGGPYSPGSTSSSDTADNRDFAESGLGQAPLRQTDTGNTPAYTQTADGSYIEYDPAALAGGYPLQAGTRTLSTAQSVAIHEATHAGVADSFDNHYGDPTNMNLPRDDAAMQASAARQMDAIVSNMQNVAYLASVDGKISETTRKAIGSPDRPFMDQQATGAVGYSQALPHAEYISVVAELKDGIKARDRNTYRDSPTYKYLGELSKQVRPLRISGQGEIQTVRAKIQVAEMTRAAAKAHTQSNQQGESSRHGKSHHGKSSHGESSRKGGSSNRSSSSR